MLAYAIAAVVDAFQRVVNLFQQMQKVCRLAFCHCGFQFLPPDHQLVTQHMQVSNLDCHKGKLLLVTECFQRQGDSDFSASATALFRFKLHPIWAAVLEGYPALALKIRLLKIVLANVAFSSGQRSSHWVFCQLGKTCGKRSHFRASWARLSMTVAARLPDRCVKSPSSLRKIQTTSPISL